MKEEKLTLLKRIEYPMRLDYANWPVKFAIREYIANAFDTGTEIDFKHDGKYAYISDEGQGLEMSNFLLGGSEKTEDQSGQFGEGSKVAALTLLREDKSVKMETAGFTAIPKKEYIEDYKKELMIMYLYKNDRKKGTTVTVECTKKEFEDAKELFLKLRKDMKSLDTKILLPRGKIFVVGLLIQDGYDSIFSYNCPKEFTNRDRNIVPNEKLKQYIIETLENTKQKAVAVEYFKHIEDTYALEYNMYLVPKDNKIWKKAMKEVLDKAVLSTGPKEDYFATLAGYKVLKKLTDNTEMLLRDLGMKGSDTVATNGAVIEADDKFVLMLNEDYCSHLDQEYALGEVISNALDTDTKVSANYENGICTIEDFGNGIKKEHFTLGSKKKTKDTIGKWGEGLDVLCLIMGREYTHMVIETIGTTYRPILEENPDYGGVKLLVIYHEKNNKTIGTKVTCEISKKVFNTVKDKFLIFDDDERKSIQNDNIEILYDRENKIYVNGVSIKSQYNNYLFSYNVKDNSVVESRDRNNVSLYKYYTDIKELIATTGKVEVIKMFLGSINNKKLKYCFEYGQSIRPENKKLWKEIFDTMFPNSIAASSNDSDEDISICMQNGFSVVDTTPSVKQVLLHIGVKNATAEAKKTKKKGISDGNKITYPFDEKYRSNLTVKDALKELIANALDTRTVPNIKFEDGFITIEDQGTGISKKNFLMGNSASRSSDKKIGTHGEGIKIAILVLARNNRKLSISTKGLDVSTRMVKNNSFKSNFLEVEMNDNDRKVGTKITAQCTQNEYSEALKQFLIYNEEYTQIDKGIYQPGGYIFVNGVRLQKTRTYFSYNVDKLPGLISQERDMVNWEMAKLLIIKNIQNATNESVITPMVDGSVTAFEEGMLDIHIPYEKSAKWEEIAQKFYDKKCLTSYSEMDVSATDSDYTIVNNLTKPQIQLMSSLGIKSAVDVVMDSNVGDKIKGILKEDNLDFVQKVLWRNALSLFSQYLKAKNMFYDISKVKIAKGFDTENTNGMHICSTHDIYINAKLITCKNPSLGKIMGVLLHENAHRVSGATDRTRDFENQLTYELGELLVSKVKYELEPSK